jgi:hypothetical protein
MNRRDFLRIGGLGLCGVTMLDVIRAQRASASASNAPARQMIVVWLGGGPPHTDMFDMKPDSPAEYRGQFRPIQTNVVGLQIGELMPELAKRADKYSIIRSVTTENRPGDHSQAPLYWLTGNPRLTTGSEEYPMYGSAISRLRPGPADVPTFMTLDEIDVHTHNQLARSYLGPAYAPFVLDPHKARDATTRMLTPQIAMPSFDRNARLLQTLDQRLRSIDAQDDLIAGLDQYQQTAFNLLRSPKLRQALDLTREPDRSIQRFTRHNVRTRYPSGNTLNFLLARRLIEVGVPVVHFNFGYWDWHGDNFTAGRQQIPMFDTALSALLDDLDNRGLLETTMVLALGEMGRKPRIDNPASAGAGRDHWDYAQFVFVAGGGWKQGAIIGATDRLGERVTDKFYKIESFGRTLYHLLGIDPDTIMTTPANRPIKLIAQETPIIREALA